MIQLYDLTCEHRNNPIGIVSKKPRFGWKIQSDKEDVLQSSWHIIAKCENEILWDSGIQEGETSVAIVYAGVELKSRHKVNWTITVMANGEEATAEASFEMGLLSPNDWIAKWIEPENEIDMMKTQPSPYLKKLFGVKENVVSARIYQTAHGIYSYTINGEECTSRKFAPGNSSYYNRLQYQVDDITNALKAGENVWAVRLGDGWWRGACGAFGIRNNYGTHLQFLGQIEITYEDGTVDIIATDESFRTSTGGLLQCDMKLGSIYDARLEEENWKTSLMFGENWANVHLGDGGHGDFSKLISEEANPVKEQETFWAKEFIDSEGNRVLDFGQNIAGYVKMTLRDCKPGQKIHIEHAEVLNKGVFDNSNINIKENYVGDMFQETIYYAKGDPIETFCPDFSVAGFRYVKITGYDSKIENDDFIAIAVYSDLKQTFSFECSNPLINKLVQNATWSQKGNFLDVPTDCPTRERAAWSGDAQVYCKTAAEIMDVYSFFEKWMKDISAEQAWNGQIPSIIPSITFHSEENKKLFIEKSNNLEGLGFLQGPINAVVGEPQMIDGCAGWGDAATIIPYKMYLEYGDKKIIENQYDCAKKWVEYMLNAAKKRNPYYKDTPPYQNEHDGILDADYIWDTDYHWGEWSEPNFVHRTLPGNFFEEKMTKAEPAVATAYMRYSSELLSKMAGLIGKEQDYVHYKEISDKIADIYNQYLIDEDGIIRYVEDGRQAPYVRALVFNVCKGEKRKKVSENLEKLVKDSDYHLNTGFLSTGMLLNALVEEGYTETAYRVLEQVTPPSWLYPVSEGATTILESWDGVQQFFGSFNHYSFGAACDFLFSYTSGIRVDENVPGYRHFYIKPVIGGSLSYATATFQSPYGEIKSSWKKEEGKIFYNITVPTGTTATVQLGNEEKKELGSGTYKFEMEG